MVAIDICRNNPIMGEWMYGITYKHLREENKIRRDVSRLSLLCDLSDYAPLFILTGRKIMPDLWKDETVSEKYQRVQKAGNMI